MEQEVVGKLGLLQANLKSATAYAKLALLSDEQNEINKYRQKACDAYEEALDLLRTVTLTQIEVESIKTQIAHLDSVLLGSGQGLS